MYFKLKLFSVPMSNSCRLSFKPMDFDHDDKLLVWVNIFLRILFDTWVGIFKYVNVGGRFVLLVSLLKE